MLTCGTELFAQMNKYTHFIICKEDSPSVSSFEGGLFYKRILKTPYIVTEYARESFESPWVKSGHYTCADYVRQGQYQVNLD